MAKLINPDKMKIGYVILAATRKPCSELIVHGFYKEKDFVFGKPAENVLPADFDNPEIFEEIKDIWQ